MRYGFIASMPQFWDHMQPIHEALPEDEQGPFVLGRERVTIRGNRMMRDSAAANRLLEASDVVCVSSTVDLKRASRMEQRVTMKGHVTRYWPRQPTVLFEHGVGFSFGGDPHVARQRQRQMSYAGGIGREGLLGLPAVNRWVQEPNQRYYPDIPSPIVGCPKLDALTALPAPRNRVPRVCISFHWDCKVAPETRWAWPHYENSLPAIARQAAEEGFELVAHGHPRAREEWTKRYAQFGIPFITEFSDVMATCDMYVNDSSSTLYEFAATGRPVVVMNAPWYRRRIQHGLRFWEHSDVGLNVEQPAHLLPAILDTLENDPRAEQRAAAIEEIYPYLGRSVPRTIEVLHDLATRIPPRSRRER